MKIAYSEIEENVVKIHTLAVELQRILEDVSSNINLLSSSDIWMGLGDEYVVSNYNKLQTNFNPIFEELERSVLFMSDVSDGYRHLDKKIKNDIMSNLNIPKLDYSDSRIFIPRTIDKKDNNEYDK